MSGYDTQKGDILASVDAVYALGVTEGKAGQALTDAAALASVQTSLDAANHTIALESQATADLQAKFDMEQAALVTLQAAFDKYKLDNPPAAPPPPPPPPPAKIAIGMNYSSAASIATANKTYEPKAKVARIFVDAGRTDITQEPEFVRAVAAGVDTVVLSWKDTTVPKWLGTVPKTIKRWYGVAHHEPEEMTPTAWKALQAAHMPAVRAAGGVPTFIFTNFSFNPKNTAMKLADWVPPAGTHDAGGVDFYPDKAANMTQAQAVANWRAAMKLFGVNRLIVGEYGVIGSASDAVADIREIKPLIADLVEVACYWSSQAAGEPDYRLTTATAAAWFA